MTGSTTRRASANAPQNQDNKTELFRRALQKFHACFPQVFPENGFVPGAIPVTSVCFKKFFQDGRPITIQWHHKSELLRSLVANGVALQGLALLYGLQVKCEVQVRETIRAGCDFFQRLLAGS